MPFMSVETIVRVLVIALAAVLANAFSRSAIRAALTRFRSSNSTLLKSAAVFDRASSLFFALIAGAMILDAFSIDIRPLLAGAGIAGLIATFGAQAVLKDIFGGFFIFFEALYEEGDRVSLDELSGRVERLTLRKTVLRDSSKRLHHIPHGNVKVITVAKKENV